MENDWITFLLQCIIRSHLHYYWTMCVRNRLPILFVHITISVKLLLVYKLSKYKYIKEQKNNWLAALDFTNWRFEYLTFCYFSHTIVFLNEKILLSNNNWCDGSNTILHCLRSARLINKYAKLVFFELSKLNWDIVILYYLHSIYTAI